MQVIRLKPAKHPRGKLSQRCAALPQRVKGEAGTVYRGGLIRNSATVSSVSLRKRLSDSAGSGIFRLMQ